MNIWFRQKLEDFILQETIKELNFKKEREVEGYNKARKDKINISLFDEIEEEQIKKYIKSIIYDFESEIEQKLIRIVNKHIDSINKNNKFYMEGKCRNYGGYECSLVEGCKSCGINPEPIK